jgi:hypothetical protein
MQFGEPDASGTEANARYAFHLSPSAFAVAPSQPLEVANSSSCGDRLDTGDVTDDLKVHLSILPFRPAPTFEPHNVPISRRFQRSAASEGSASQGVQGFASLCYLPLNPPCNADT